MRKKFFSLIKGGKIHASKNKIIPAKEFSTLLNASDVLRQVQEDADQYRIEVAKECELLKEQAQRDGFEAGFKQWADHVAYLEKEIQRVRADMERLAIPVALKAAKKIVGREIELSEDTIVDIIGNSLKAVSQHKRITIYVNRKDYEVVEKNRPRLKQLFEDLEALSIRERADVAPGGCIIETEGGIINAQMENQWRVLESALEFLIKRKDTGNALH